jgi:hypothetical protein
MVPERARRANVDPKSSVTSSGDLSTISSSIYIDADENVRKHVRIITRKRCRVGIEQ